MDKKEFIEKAYKLKVEKIKADECMDELIGEYIHENAPVRIEHDNGKPKEIKCIIETLYKRSPLGTAFGYGREKDTVYIETHIGYLYGYTLAHPESFQTHLYMKYKSDDASVNSGLCEMSQSCEIYPMFRKADGNGEMMPDADLMIYDKYFRWRVIDSDEVHECNVHMKPEGVEDIDVRRGGMCDESLVGVLVKAESL